jgi:hypothetical protein
MTKYQDRKPFAHINNDIEVIGEEEIREVESREITFACEFCRRTLCKLSDGDGKNISYYCTQIVVLLHTILTIYELHFLLGPHKELFSRAYLV